MDASGHMENVPNADFNIWIVKLINRCSTKELQERERKRGGRWGWDRWERLVTGISAWGWNPGWKNSLQMEESHGAGDYGAGVRGIAVLVKPYLDYYGFFLLLFAPESKVEIWKVINLTHWLPTPQAKLILNYFFCLETFKCLLRDPYAVNEMTGENKLQKEKKMFSWQTEVQLHLWKAASYN